MILNKEQMKTLIREEAVKIRKNMELERERSKRISEIEKRKAEILSILGENSLTDNNSDTIKQA
jgi:hypothetical protein